MNSDVSKICNVSKSDFGRVEIAGRKGQDLGRVGRPNKLNRTEMDIFLERVENYLNATENTHDEEAIRKVNF